MGTWLHADSRSALAFRVARATCVCSPLSTLARLLAAVLGTRAAGPGPAETRGGQGWWKATSELRCSGALSWVTEHRHLVGSRDQLPRSLHLPALCVAKRVQGRWCVIGWLSLLLLCCCVGATANGNACVQGVLLCTASAVCFVDVTYQVAGSNMRQYALRSSARTRY